jgi:hypothetical protein
MITKWCLKNFIFVLAAVLFPLSALSLEGPLRLKNQFPLFLHLNTPVMEKATPEDSLSASLHYSSVFMKKSSADWLVDLDMELAELDLNYKKDFPGLVEIGLELPVLGFSSGVLDQPLETYHSAFGFPDYGRSRYAKNEFHYRVFRNGKRVVSGESGRVGLGDLRLTAKKTFSFGNSSLAVKGDIEFPTGEPNTGFGNGSLDLGLSAIAEWKPAALFLLTGTLGLVFPGDLKAYETVDLQPYYYLGLAGEWAIWKRLSVIGQALAQTSPYPETGISAIDRTGVILTLGGRYASGLNSVEFSFTEDLNVTGAPDFTFQLGFKHKFK